MTRWAAVRLVGNSIYWLHFVGALVSACVCVCVCVETRPRRTLSASFYQRVCRVTLFMNPLANSLYARSDDSWGGRVRVNVTREIKSARRALKVSHHSCTLWLRIRILQRSWMHQPSQQQRFLGFHWLETTHRFNFGELWHANLHRWSIANSLDKVDLWGHGETRTQSEVYHISFQLCAYGCTDSIQIASFKELSAAGDGSCEV